MNRPDNDEIRMKSKASIFITYCLYIFPHKNVQNNTENFDFYDIIGYMAKLFNGPLFDNTHTNHLEML